MDREPTTADGYPSVVCVIRSGILLGAIAISTPLSKAVFIEWFSEGIALLYEGGFFNVY